MKIKYDKEADAMYIKLNDKGVYRASKKISKDVLVDYSQDGDVIGVEILNSSQNIPLPTNVNRIALERV